MFQIGEFSKLTRTTVKTLRYYDAIGLLKPERVDEATGYRFYSTAQLLRLHEIKAMRQLGLSIGEILQLAAGGDRAQILCSRRERLSFELAECRRRLSGIDFLLNNNYTKEEKFMNYQAIIKEVPEYLVYAKRMTVATYEELYAVIPEIGAKVMAKYPELKCVKPEYCMCIFHDEEYKERDIDVEFCEAIDQLKPDFEDIYFKRLPAARVLSVFHKGPYEKLYEANVFAYSWLEENGYQPVGAVRNNYIDGIWNKESEAEWLTELQIPLISKEEIKAEYGDSLEYKDWAKRDQGKPDQKQIVKETEEFFARFAAIRHLPPEGREAQSLVRDWQGYISATFYACSDEMLGTLGEMYTADERFKANIDAAGIGTAEFVAAAIKHYVAAKK